MNTPNPESPLKFSTPDLSKLSPNEEKSTNTAEKPKRPPDAESKPPNISRRRLSVTFADEVHYSESPTSSDSGTKNVSYTFFPPPLATVSTPDLAGLGLKDVSSQPMAEEKIAPAIHRAKSDDELLRTSSASLTMEECKEDKSEVQQHDKIAQKPENFMLGFLWLLYLSWMARASM